jgi:hypothetical protein
VTLYVTLKINLLGVGNVEARETLTASAPVNPPEIASRALTSFAFPGLAANAAASRNVSQTPRRE